MSGYYKLKAYERNTNKIFVSKKLCSIDHCNNALMELMLHFDIGCVFLKFGNTQTKHIIPPKQQKKPGSLCYIGSDGKKIYGISISEFLTNADYRSFIESNNK